MPFHSRHAPKWRDGHAHIVVPIRVDLVRFPTNIRHLMCVYVSMCVCVDVETKKQQTNQWENEVQIDYVCC